MNIHVPISQPNECEDYRGFYPLNSITIDKIIASASDLEKSISELMSLIDNKSDSISIEQSENIFSETIGTVEMSLMSILNFLKIQKSPQLRSIVTSMPKDNALFSLFYDYTQLAVKVYNQKVFYNPTFFPFIIFFTNLCCYYIDIFQNPNSPNLKKDFQSAWNENYTISIRQQLFYKEVGISREFSKLERYFDSAEIANLGQIVENNLLVFDVAQAMKILKKDVQAYEKDDYSINMIQNMVIDLESLRSNFSELRTSIKDSDQKIYAEKLAAINSFLAMLESCVSFNNLIEMSNKLNILIRSDVFSLPSDIIHNEYNNWICFKLAMQVIQLNLKMFVSIRFTLNQIDQQSIDCYKFSKRILSIIEKPQNEPQLPEMIQQFINDMAKVRPLNEASFYKSFTLLYDEQVELMVRNFDEKYKDYSNRVKSDYENFKSCSKLFNEKGTLKTATNRFNFYSNFEDIFRSLQHLPQGDFLKVDESLLKIKFYIEMSIIHCANQSLLLHIQNTFGHLPGNSEFYQALEKERTLKSTLTTLLQLINSIYSEKDEPKEAEIFLCFFRLFLRVCITVFELNEKDKNDKYGKIITFILTYFPKNERMKIAIPVQSRIDELRFLISKIQTETIKVNEVVFAHVDPKNSSLLSSIKDTPDTTLVKFFECEQGYTDILNALKLLEKIKQTVQFFLIYSNFLKRYKLNLTIAHSLKGSSISSLLFEYFPHFTDEMIYILKSPYLNVNVSPSFLKKWLAFIRSLILNELVDRKDAFQKMVSKMPFVDYSRLIRVSFINFLKVDSIVKKTIEAQKNNCGKDNGLEMQQIKEKEKKYIEESNHLKKLIANLIVPLKFDNPNYDNGGNTLISTILHISSDLHNQVRKYWSKILLIFRFYEKFNLLVKRATDIRDDFQIQKKEFPKKLFQYVNLVISINLSLKEVNKSNYISNELKMIIAKFNQKVDDIYTNFKVLFYSDAKQIEDRIYPPLLLVMIDLEKELLQTNMYQFTNAIRSILAQMLPLLASSSSDQSYARCEDCVNEILQLIECIEKDSVENKFSVLFEIKRKIKKFKQFQDPLFVEFYNQLKHAVNSELNISFIKGQIAIYNTFLLSIVSDNHNVIDSVIVKSSSFHQIDCLPSICQIPEILQKFDFIINKFFSQNKLKKMRSNDDGDYQKDEIFTNLTSALLNVKINAGFRVNEIFKSLNLTQANIENVKAINENYRRLQKVYSEKLNALGQIRSETRAIKFCLNDKLAEIQEQIAIANQEGMKLKYDYKNLAEIEKMQIEYFNKPASENLQWAKLILSGLMAKNNDKRKNTGSTMNLVLPVINSEIKDNSSSYNLPKNAKISNAMIVEIEQRFQKTFEKNKKLWEKAKSFTKNKINEDGDVTIPENELANQSNEQLNKSCFNDDELLVKSDEIAKEFNSTVDTVYTLFNRSTFLQQILFSHENNDQESFFYATLASGSSSSSANQSGSNSANSSGNITYQSSASLSGSSSIGYSGASYDEEEVLDMLDAFNNELFDRAIRFYFINKILQRKSEKKSRRKIKVKKPRKSVLKEILDEEIQNK